LCLVHLVRRGGSQESLRTFITSYRNHDPGVSHCVVLLLKGFRSSEEARPYSQIAGSLVDDTVHVSDSGFDLTAYANVALRLGCRELCFLNSNSAILHSGWLAMLQSALTADVGIVGATGSWNSSLSVSRYFLHLPSAYSKLFPDRAWLQAQLDTLQGIESASGVPAGSRWSRLAAIGGRHLTTAYTQFAFRPFPAPHIRTNAFLIRADVMSRLKVWPMHWKPQAWRLESGRGGITSQIEHMGLRALVVGRDSVSYQPDDWHRSATFWQDDQQNLLVADNQTNAYRDGDVDRRSLLSRLAWGDLARL
jgi:hypothetical protein